MVSAVGSALASSVSYQLKLPVLEQAGDVAEKSKSGGSAVSMMAKVIAAIALPVIGGITWAVTTPLTGVVIVLGLGITIALIALCVDTSDPVYVTPSSLRYREVVHVPQPVPTPVWIGGSVPTPSTPPVPVAHHTVGYRHDSPSGGPLVPPAVHPGSVSGSSHHVVGARHGTHQPPPGGPMVQPDGHYTVGYRH